MYRLGDDPRWQAVAKQLTERLELAHRGPGRDFEAESIIRCLRDGIPPPRVRERTIGRGSLISALTLAIEDTLAGRPRRPIVLRGKAGEGRTHMLQWAREEGSLRKMAVASLSLDGASLASPAKLQTALLSQVRIDDRSLEELAIEPTSLASTTAWTKLLPQLTAELSAPAIRALSELWEAWRRDRLDLGLQIVCWMRGEQIDPESRRRFDLPAKLQFAGTAEGVLRSVLALGRLFGAGALLVTVDGGGSEATRALGIERALGRILVLSESTLRSRAAALLVEPLSASERRSLALLIRNDHIAAYNWPAAESLVCTEIEAWAQTSSPLSTRDFVRQIIHNLDCSLLAQEMR